MTSEFPARARGLQPAFDVAKSGFCWSLEELASLPRYPLEQFQTPLFAGVRFPWPFRFLRSLRWEPCAACLFPRTRFLSLASGSADRARIRK